MYNDYESEYDEYDSDDLQSCAEFLSKLYFYKETYSIRLVSQLYPADDITECSFIIEKTGGFYPKMPSIVELYEIFNHSFLLEFLISVLVNKPLIFDSVQKLISVTDTNECVSVTASFSSNQNYIHIEDEIESDNRVTDIMYIGQIPTMRSYQYFYSLTQAAKYCTLKYDVINDRKINWLSKHIDWQIVYSQFIEVYILQLISHALQIQVNSVDQYKDYMTFHVQFIINRSESTLYSEFFILPDTVFNHKILYNKYDGREICISNQKVNDPGFNLITADELRLCAGSQNSSLIPINLHNIYHTLDDGKDYIVMHETQSKEDTLFNKFALSMYRYSTLPKSIIVYTNPIEGIEPSIFPIPLPKNNSADTGVLCNTIFTYEAFVNPINAALEPVEFYDDMKIYGRVMLRFTDLIPADVYTYPIDESNEDTFLPSNFYKTLSKVYNITNAASYALIPIRAYPIYREFMVVGRMMNSNPTESQSSIITSTSNDTILNKQKPNWFRSLFGN